MIVGEPPDDLPELVPDPVEPAELVEPEPEAEPPLFCPAAGTGMPPEPVVPEPVELDDAPPQAEISNVSSSVPLSSNVCHVRVDV